MMSQFDYYCCVFAPLLKKHERHRKTHEKNKELITAQSVMHRYPCGPCAGSKSSVSCNYITRINCCVTGSLTSKIILDFSVCSEKQAMEPWVKRIYTENKSLQCIDKFCCLWAMTRIGTRIGVE